MKFDPSEAIPATRSTEADLLPLRARPTHRIVSRVLIAEIRLRDLRKMQRPARGASQASQASQASAAGTHAAMASCTPDARAPSGEAASSTAADALANNPFWPPCAPTGAPQPYKPACGIPPVPPPPPLVQLLGLARLSRDTIEVSRYALIGERAATRSVLAALDGPDADGPDAHAAPDAPPGLPSAPDTQRLEVASYLGSLCLWRHALEQEVVPAWADREFRAQGFTLWRSRFRGLRALLAAH